MCNEYVYVAGWKELSLVDVVESTSFTVWFNFCNFNCPWCSNAHVVKGIEKRRIRVIDLFNRVKEAVNFIDYFHVTGGEPTLQPKPLFEIFRMVHEKLSLPNSLDTNGSYPEVLSKLMTITDHIAIDVKAPLSNPLLYSKSIGLPLRATEFFIPRIRKSLEESLNVNFFEVRTTLVPKLIEKAEVIEIARDLLPIVSRGRKRVIFIVQQFIPYGNIMSEEYRSSKRTPPEYVKEIAKEVAEILPTEVYYRTLEEGTKKIQ